MLSATWPRLDSAYSGQILEHVDPVGFMENKKKKGELLPVYQDLDVLFFLDLTRLWRFGEHFAILLLVTASLSNQWKVMSQFWWLIVFFVRKKKTRSSFRLPVSFRLKFCCSVVRLRRGFGCNEWVRGDCVEQFLSFSKSDSPTPNSRTDWPSVRWNFSLKPSFLFADEFHAGVFHYHLLICQ